MNNTRSTLKRFLQVSGVTLGAVTLASPSVAQADVTPFAWSDCPSGYSCYWEHANGGGDIWRAPSPGCHNLGTWNPPFNDRISSFWNRGGGVVHMYNWSGSDWIWVDDVPRNAQESYSSGDSRNDKIDRVCIDS